ncbi:MAG: GTP pyrophosphokinase family protein [Lachnospiraceae bacterium]|nr:GTP pyrophosphokinase family protein [Candidatus Equihabitans merdae]
MEIQLWRELLDPYDQAVSELTVKLNNVIREYKRKNIYCPMERVSGRVKTISSIMDKKVRKNIDFENLFTEIEDIAGIRIICQFEGDIKAAVELLEKRSDLKIIRVKDYLTNKKESGYRSYHLIALYTVDTTDGPKELQVEFQIRTLAMNFWATSEHMLQYKYQGELPAHLRRSLANIAEVVTLLDREMMKVRQEIMDAEMDSEHKNRLMQDILSTIEMLFRKNNVREAIKIQNEFYEVLNHQSMEELIYFHDHLDLLSEDTRTQVF